MKVKKNIESAEDTPQDPKAREWEKRIDKADEKESREEAHKVTGLMAFYNACHDFVEDGSEYYHGRTFHVYDQTRMPLHPEEGIMHYYDDSGHACVIEKQGITTNGVLTDYKFLLSPFWGEFPESVLIDLAHDMHAYTEPVEFTASLSTGDYREAEFRSASLNTILTDIVQYGDGFATYADFVELEMKYWTIRKGDRELDLSRLLTEEIFNDLLNLER